MSYKVCSRSNDCCLRHDDDREVQPVPRISQEGERHYTESSCKYLYHGLEGVNSSESISGKYSERDRRQSALNSTRPERVCAFKSTNSVTTRTKR